jgi:hypothetical protein
MIILAIDPGVLNLGIGVYNTYYNEKGECIINKVILAVTINIYKFCNDFDCSYKKVNNVNTLTNRITHVIHHYKTWFNTADYILIEHQSPNVLTSKIDEIFSSIYMNRIIHLNIAKMAVFYKYKSLYTEKATEKERRKIRKEYSISLALKSGLFTEEITDHVSDTYLFANYYCLTSQKKSKYFLEG